MGRLYAGNYELAIIEMMKKILLLLFVTTALGAVAAPARSYEVKSPDGTLSIVLSVGDRLSFSVLRNGAELVAPSRIALTLSTGEVLGENPKVRSAHRRSVAETVEAPLHRQSSLDIAFNELNLRCRDGYGIIARAYDDGVCYRFYTERDGELTIMDETAQLNFADDPSAYIPYANTKIPMRTSFENTYTYAPLSEFRTGTLAFMPILVDLGARGYVLYTESDVESYPGIYVGYDAGAKGLTARFAGYPIEMSLTKRFEDIVETSEEYIARVAGSRSYPWRIVACAETAAELPVNDMVWKTAEASRVSDVSWIRDGKIAWDWWNDWGVYGVDFKSGINTETYKYFIDFAAEHGIEYVALDEGWSVRDGDILHVIPEIDLPQIVSYGRQKGVGIVLWVVAKVLDDNGPVWTDSCVEFFFRPDTGDRYYNFETNCIGTMLLGRRRSRDDAEHAPADVLRRIRRQTTYSYRRPVATTGDNRWRLTLVIPVTALFGEELKSWAGVHGSMNLYKCGDSLARPHYLSWQPVATPHPDFHRPEFFKPVLFEPQTDKQNR